MWSSFPLCVCVCVLHVWPFTLQRHRIHQRPWYLWHGVREQRRGLRRYIFMSIFHSPNVVELRHPAAARLLLRPTADITAANYIMHFIIDIYIYQDINSRVCVCVCVPPISYSIISSALQEWEINLRHTHTLCLSTSSSSTTTAKARDARARELYGN